MEIVNTLGRRKTSVARVYLSKGTGKLIVNKKDYKEVFPVAVLQSKIEQPFAVTSTEGQFDVKVNVFGGGINGQAEAIRLGISRALVVVAEENKTLLKAEGFTFDEAYTSVLKRAIRTLWIIQDEMDRM